MHPGLLRRLIAMALALAGMVACSSATIPTSSPTSSPTPTLLPAAAPTPTASPSPSPSAAPASTCPLKVDARHYVRVIISPFGSGNYTESTQLCVSSLPNDLPFEHCGTLCCFIGVIDVPPPYSTCDDELFGGPPTWTVAGPGDIVVNAGQPYNVKVYRSGQGTITLTACGNKGPCGSVDDQDQ